MERLPRQREPFHGQRGHSRPVNHDSRNPAAGPAWLGATPAKLGTRPADLPATPANRGTPPAGWGATPASQSALPATPATAPAEPGTVPASRGASPAIFLRLPQPIYESRNRFMAPASRGMTPATDLGLPQAFLSVFLVGERFPPAFYHKTASHSPSRPARRAGNLDATAFYGLWDGSKSAKAASFVCKMI